MKVADTGTLQSGRQRSPHFKSGRLRPYLRVANILDGSIDAIQVNQMQFTDKEFEVFRLVGGDILLNEGQSLQLVGRPAIYRNDPPECCFQNTLIRYRAFRGFDTEFMLRLFQYCLYSGAFAAIATQTTSIAHLGLSRFANLRIPIPPHDEQRFMAAVIDTADAAVRKSEALLEAKINYKRALGEDLLTGRRRFPEFTGEGWHRVVIGHVLEEIERPVVWDDDASYDLVSVRRRSGGLFRRGEKQGATILTKRLKQVREGDFVLSKMQVVHGAWATVTQEFDLCHVSDSYITLIAKQPLRIDTTFLGYLSQLTELYSLALKCSHGVHIEKMTFNLNEFLRKSIQIPSLPEQRRIADCLSLLDDEIRLLRRRRDILKLQKQGLMQRLLTGEVRLPEFRDPPLALPQSPTTSDEEGG
jgi:type I restriction enzyme S subunit